MLTDYFDAYVGAYRPYKGGTWCYEDGCIYRGLELLYRATGEERWLSHLLRLIEPQVRDGPSLAGYDPSDYNIDNIHSGRALLFLHETTSEQRWLDAAALLASQLATHPRTQSGVYWHKLRYPWQVWLDGLYMGPPFQIGYGLAVNQPTLIADALRQVSIALDMAFVPQTGLYVHAVDEARKQGWANPETGRSAAHWARALGWLSMGLVDIAELVGPSAFAPLAERTEQFLGRVLSLRQPSGLWLQVIDRPDLPGNYEESSASAMFVYALIKAERLKIAASRDDLLDRLTASVMRPNGSTLAMADICEVAGLGKHEKRFRDGSPEYYLTEARVADDAKGVGPLMMSSAMGLMSENEALPMAAGMKA